MAQTSKRYILIACNGKKFSIKVLSPDADHRLFRIYYRKMNAVLSNWRYLDDCIDLVFIESTVRRYFGYLSELRVV